MNDFKTASFIAYKSILKGNKSTHALLIFVLSLSFLNMMFISGILSGLENTFTKVIIDVWSSHIIIAPEQEPQQKQFIQNQNEVRSQIETIPGVIATARHYQLAGSVSFDKEKNGVSKSISGAILGIDPSQEKGVLTLDSFMLEGEYLSDQDTDQILLSSALAGGYGLPAPNDLGGVKVGDKVQLTFSNGIIRTYNVKGIYDDSIGIFFTYITAREAESVLSTYNNASQILVKTDLSRKPIAYFEKNIKQLFPKLSVQNYTVILGTAGAFINALNLISFIVGAISVIVAAITIFVLIYVNATNKRRQIGILKAIGIKQNIIIVSYVLQSIFYSICGVIIGAILVFGILTPLLAKYPINITFADLSLMFTPSVIIIGVVSLLVAGLVAGYIPARIVVKQEILKSIWR